MKLEEEKRFALLLAVKDSEYVKKMYGGYFNVFVQAFGDEGEAWDLFRVVEGEFPNAEDLNKYDGFVKRVLGVCFGHQVLCRALGGRVGKARGGWDLGVRKVTMVDGLQHWGFLKGLTEEIPPYVSIIECHQDEVWEVPLGAEVIAVSDKTSVEAFIIGDHILGLQGHPEYTKDILYNIIDRLASNDVIDGEVAEEAKANAEGAEPDRRFWEKVCKGFLKGQRKEEDASLNI